MKKKIIAAFVISVLLLTACATAPAQPQQPTQNAAVSTPIPATQTSAIPTPVPATPTPAPSPEMATGSIAGWLSSSSENLPAMRVVAFSTTSSQQYSVDTSVGQTGYQIDGVPVGSYTVVAYRLSGSSFLVGEAGGYTEVMRGHAGNHTLMAVNVFRAGQVTRNINPGDYAPEGVYPSMPGMIPGSITGSLSSPSEALPAIRVVAFSTTSSQQYSVDTPAGQDWYQMDGVPVGSYIVVAYSLGGDGVAAGKAGGYTEAMRGDANNHTTMATVNVAAGQTTKNIDPGDWSAAAAGMYPPMPDGASPTIDPGGPQPLTEGAIVGSLTFPSEVLPAMTVFAFSTASFPNGSNHFITTQPGQNNYTIALPGGDYYIVAYALDEHGLPTMIGGYTACKVAGPECTDHSLVTVNAANGSATTDISPADWYAPEGTFPPYPLLP